jgi:hypothetical protein
MTQITFNDYDNQIRLDNYDYGDAVYLIDANNFTIDCMEYGHEGDRAGGAPTSGAWEGYSFNRDVVDEDSDNSADDFFYALPTPGRNASRAILFFYSGWNPVDIPILGNAYEDAEALGRAIPTCKYVARWNATSDELEVYTVGRRVDAFAITPGYGYFVYVETYTGLQVYGEALTNETRNLPAGWVSAGLLAKETTASALRADIGSSCRAIAVWHTSLGRFVMHTPLDISDFTVSREQTFLAYLAAATTWTNTVD